MTGSVRRMLVGACLGATVLGGTAVVAAPAEARFTATVRRTSCDSWWVRWRLTDADGDPVEGRWTRFRTGDGLLAPRLTDEDGRAKYHIDSPKPPGRRYKFWVVLVRSGTGPLGPAVAKRGPWRKKNICARDDGATGAEGWDWPAVVS